MIEKVIGKRNPIIKKKYTIKFIQLKKKILIAKKKNYLDMWVDRRVIGRKIRRKLTNNKNGKLEAMALFICLVCTSIKKNL